MAPRAGCDRFAADSENRIDHRLYDHASIPATVEALFGLAALTARDRSANSLDKLVTLSAARDDAPATLPPPATSLAGIAAHLVAAMTPVTRPNDTADEGNLPAILNSAMQQDLDASPGERSLSWRGWPRSRRVPTPALIWRMCG